MKKKKCYAMVAQNKVHPWAHATLQLSCHGNDAPAQRASQTPSSHSTHTQATLFLLRFQSAKQTFNAIWQFQVFCINKFARLMAAEAPALPFI